MRLGDERGVRVRKGRIPVLINTPLQRGVVRRRGDLNRFSGFPRDMETAEAVKNPLARAITPLKRGVKERCPQVDAG